MLINKFFQESLCVQRLISLLKSLKLKRLYISGNPVSEEFPYKTVIFMIDGKIAHGGLCDRLHGLISTFLFCKENNLRFRVWWKYPFDLELFLQPNFYNWHIDESEMSYIKSVSTPYYWGTIHNEKKQLQLAKQLLTMQFSQIHAYTNMHYKREELHENFYKIFKLSPILKEAIDFNLKNIGANYISMTFRFQRLLGDFDEGDFPILDITNQMLLMKQCKETIEKIKKENVTVSKILVTSDSITFLKYLKENLDYIYTIDGELCHMDFVKNETNELRHMKSFVDLMMISKAQKAYLIRKAPMYRSSFAKTAALIGGIPYEEYDL